MTTAPTDWGARRAPGSSGRASGGRWLRSVQASSSARFRVYCFSHAGAGAMSYRAWAGGLPPQVEIHAVQLPGREDRMREPPVSSLPALAAEIAREIPADGTPYGLFGHSFGALLAFEVARRLEADASRPGPARLWASGHTAPHAPVEPVLHTLPDDELVSFLGRLSGEQPGSAAAAEVAELLDAILPTLRADLVAGETFDSGPPRPLASAVSVFGGTDDLVVPHERLSEWRAWASGDFRVHVIPGNHFFVSSAAPRVHRIIADDIELDLARCAA